MNLNWFDTHCHLDTEHNPEGPDAALGSASLALSFTGQVSR